MTSLNFLVTGLITLRRAPWADIVEGVEIITIVRRDLLDRHHGACFTVALEVVFYISCLGSIRHSRKAGACRSTRSPQG